MKKTQLNQIYVILTLLSKVAKDAAEAADGGITDSQAEQLWSDIGAVYEKTKQDERTWAIANMITDAFQSDQTGELHESWRNDFKSIGV